MTTQSSSTESAVDNVKHIAGEAAEKQKAIAAKAMVTLSESTKFVWRAWLGTAVTIEQRITKAAVDMAKRGQEFESKAKVEAVKRKDQAKESTAKMKQKAEARIDDVEQIIDRGVSRSLNFLGVPTRQDMNRLTLMVQDVAESINELAGKTNAAAAKDSQKKSGGAKSNAHP